MFLRGCGVNRWRPTLATPVTSRVGPPWSFVSQAPPHRGSRELISWSWRATWTRASFTQRAERTFVWDADSDQSLRSCTAPRLLATIPPKGSMFSFVVSE